MDFKLLVAHTVSAALASAFEAPEAPDAAELAAWLETPPNPELGDFAFPCFKLAKSLRKGPPAIASALAEAITGFPGRAEATGGYLNFFIDAALYAREVLSAALKPDYGTSNEGSGKTICIDYSSINISKRFHIGHLATTMIGHALKNIYKSLGYRVVGINHLGDWGTQFGKLIAAYHKWGDDAAMQANPMGEMERLYVKFHDEAERDPSLDDEGRAWFKRIEDGDKQAWELFELFKEITLAYAMKIYDELGVSFDSYAGESFYNDKMGRVLDELKAKNLLVESDGAQVVDLEAYNMPPCILVKRDGATLYATRDMAAALYRADTYSFDRCLYVVASHQDLHFRQWFKAIELMGYPWAGSLHHVSYGMVSLEDGPLSSRKGRVVYLEDLLSRAKEKALGIIEEKSPGLEGKEAIAAQVGVSAVIFGALYNSRIKDVVFSWERTLSFDGENAPYVMYTHARCCSVLRKVEGEDQDGLGDAEGLTNPQAMDVLRCLDRFPDVLRDAAERYEPYLVARWTVDLAQVYNRFYFEHRILEAEPEQRKARIALTRAVRGALAKGLSLLGVASPERM